MLSLLIWLVYLVQGQLQCQRPYDYIYLFDFFLFIFNRTFVIEYISNHFNVSFIFKVELQKYSCVDFSKQITAI